MPGFADIPGRPEYTAKQELQNKLDGLMKKFGSGREKSPAPGAMQPPSIPTPTSKEEYDKLPSGSQYMKDGKRYIKG
jgi:hypothetical protein